MTALSAFWRRLDLPGHDACRLTQTAHGWRLSGMAVFQHEGGAACLAYEAACDRAWHSREGRVNGWFGTQPIDVRISRATQGLWTLNGSLVPNLADCLDLDFSFTPATNFFQIHRMGLEQGQRADAPAAWLDLPAATLVVLRQRYERQGEAIYRYEAPALHYEADLEITATGFVRRYPGLWEFEG
jgi:hypothetical protein